MAAILAPETSARETASRPCSKLTCFEDLDSGDLELASHFWTQAISIAPEYARKDLSEEFNLQSFVKSTFVQGWNSDKDWEHVLTRRNKTTNMTSAQVGVWNRDVQGTYKKTAPVAQHIPDFKRKGGPAFCRPDVVGDTIVFKIVDERGALHKLDDVAFGGSHHHLDDSLKATVCAHFDHHEMNHVTQYNLRVARRRLQRHFRETYGPNSTPPAESPLPKYMEMTLRYPILEKMLLGPGSTACDA
ncbi:hypothetical protein KJ359_007529 [Pestalotiopsis sp. 9143b]|nr:hypothetical protein KJ359_007529 [Pestalotiopsis sp. 9143b]